MHCVNSCANYRKANTKANAKAHDNNGQADAGTYDNGKDHIYTNTYDDDDGQANADSNNDGQASALQFHVHYLAVFYARADTPGVLSNGLPQSKRRKCLLRARHDWPAHFANCAML